MVRTNSVFDNTVLPDPGGGGGGLRGLRPHREPQLCVGGAALLFAELLGKIAAEVFGLRQTAGRQIPERGGQAVLLAALL